MKPLALVIENDGGTRRLLDVLLTRSGLEVALAPTGSDALVLLQNVQYGLVVIDLLLPGANGMQVLEWLSEQRPRAIARSVVISSAPESQLQRVRDQWPAVRVIRKPFELGEIVEYAQRVIASRDERMPSLAEDFCRKSVRAGARAGLIVRRQTARLEALHSFGYEPGEVDAYFPLTLDDALPLCAAIRNVTPVWLASVTTATTEYPLLRPVFERNQSRALAVVPLLHQGHAVGAVGWSFREARLFSEGERQLFLSIASSLASGLPLEPGQSVSVAGA